MSSIFEKLQLLQFGWRDAIDVLLVALVIYNILTLIRGTRAMQMSIGILLVAVAYFVSQFFDLIALETLFRALLFYAPFAFVVLFQNEIRRALANFGRNPLGAFVGSKRAWLDNVTEAAHRLSQQRTGALIVLERDQSLRVWVESGKQLDATISTELLMNLFVPNTPLHDGAVIIRADRIAAAGVFLPLSTNAEIAPNYGTRHRAAIGLTEETDAVVVIVSEENGSIAVAREGELIENLDRERLLSTIERSLSPRRRLT